MSTSVELFIKREDRPDLRAAMTDIDEVDLMDGEALSSPMSYHPLMKDCSGDKSDKSDKKKEIGKDDKGTRNAQGAPGGPVTDISQRLWRGEDDAARLRDAIDQTLFS
jgi:hypothetical protein